MIMGISAKILTEQNPLNINLKRDRLAPLSGHFTLEGMNPWYQMGSRPRVLRTDQVAVEHREILW
jgi:hypothetical protein